VEGCGRTLKMNGGRNFAGMKALSCRSGGILVTIIVVSNRVARPKPDEAVQGGLAAALLPAVKNSGAIWVGASGRLAEPGIREALAEIQPLGAGALATVDMPGAHYHRFYEGFANSVLWPAFHSRADLIRADLEDYASYREINAFMARSLLRFARPNATFWVHDYHFLTLGAELRERGVTQPIGFFLHTPFPSRTVMVGVPRHRELVRAMLAYDLIGFQTEDDLANFSEYLRRELGLKSDGDTWRLGKTTTRLAAFPIGIDVKAFADRATKAAAQPEVSRLRGSLQGRKLAIGVDRLDYSKGLPNRFRAVDRMFEIDPDLKKTMHLLQIAVPSRIQIPAYQQLQAELAGLVGEINGKHADIDWTPIRYLNRSFPQAALAGFYRSAHVGLITPFHDGMNLVAKEYVAAQNPLDPGVLVLSEFAGAARQLDAAVLVNPHDIDGMAHGLIRALSMPAAERRERWNSMIARLEDSALDAWFSDFMSALADTPVRVGSPPIAAGYATPTAVTAARKVGTALSH
jgi:trehalose 6-phosphate synthase